MQTVLFHKHKGLEKEQQETSAGKEGETPCNSLLLTHSTTNLQNSAGYCLSFPLSLPGTALKQQEMVSYGSSAFPFIASGHPSPSRQLARMDAPGTMEHLHPDRGGSSPALGISETA